MTPGQIQKHLVHLLEVYPILSPTMIQAFLGSKVRPSTWKPIMEEMIRGDILIRYEVISQNTWGQLRTYTCIKLNDEYDDGRQ